MLKLISQEREKTWSRTRLFIKQGTINNHIDNDAGIGVQYKYGLQTLMLCHKDDVLPPLHFSALCDSADILTQVCINILQNGCN